MKKITTMNPFLFLITCILIANVALSQQQSNVSQHWCGSTEATNATFIKHPELKQQFESYQAKFNTSLKEAKKNKALTKTSAVPNYTIPVVFHILHINGIENISDAQISDAMKVLNADFAKQNADTINTIPTFTAIAALSNIRFALARKDPNGNCTNGIIRYYDTDANWNENSSTLYSHTWDPTKYLNVYIVKTITFNSGFGAAGFTYLPGTFFSGYEMDAIVLLNTYAGTIGTSDPSHAHVLSHEVGHWLNLYHVFGSNACAVDCNNDDFVFDTPQTPGYLSCPNIATPSSYQQCTPGVSENFQNIMDYSYCSTMFTYDQVARMEAETQSSFVGRDNLGTASNLAFTGINPLAQCAPVANFKSNLQTICIGQSINFSDLSNVGTPTTWSWNFQGGSPSTSSIANPTITYNNPGTYSVQLIAGNNVGSSSPKIKTNYITVLPNPITSSLAESFEGSSIPNNTWSIKNSADLNTNWSQTSSASSTGNKSAYVSQNVMPVSTVELYSPTYNFNGMPGVALTLKWTGAERDQTTADCDVFSVQFSTNCGLTWLPRLVRNIRSTTTGVSSVVTGNFYPTSSQFVQEVIPIAGLTNQANILFKLKFVTESGSSNNFYVDDINLTSVTAIKEQYALLNLLTYPNPAKENIFVSFDLLEDKKVSIELNDILGRTLQSIPNQVMSAGHQETSIPISHLSKGIYFVNIRVNEILFTEKMVIE